MEQTRTLGFFCSAGEKGGRRADSISLTFPVLAQVQRLSGHSFKLVKTEERDQRKALPVWGICIVNYPPPLPITGPGSSQEGRAPCEGRRN